MTASEQWADKVVLITGVCGTVGGELLRQLDQRGVGSVVGLDNNESALFFLRESYRERDGFHFYLGDVRDRDTLVRRMRGVDIVLHTAALKHVILCEHSPTDALATNILGVQNVIEAAISSNVERVLFTSSDKAVNPTNVMGTSKLMGERLITAANALRHEGGPIFASTRFGNVLGSAGSVIPLFRRQIEAGGPLTLTDPAMTRFIMSLEEAVRLVMDSAFMSRGGEVFVTKMPVVRIVDLAEVMVTALAPVYGRRPEDVPIEVIGPRAGEKMYEELLNDEEMRRTLELDRYFVVTPALKGIYTTIEYVYPGVRELSHDRPYHSSSETPMSQEEILAYLKRVNLLEES
ncbi:MAG: polysaccharide biosynthesis protein [Myxococcales bacterium]|nr:polysaccharide biosynthesis protein [Myxococcales bacterium]